mmetsp:Transcript_42275/g.96312  ORF Transcript_42275/g.96312 Transcript_42275/m.96312 type:complete len:251 (+) Transcript_42275:109-861(+)
MLDWTRVMMMTPTRRMPMNPPIRHSPNPWETRQEEKRSAPCSSMTHRLRRVASNIPTTWTTTGTNMSTATETPRLPSSPARQCSASFATAPSSQPTSVTHAPTPSESIAVPLSMTMSRVSSLSMPVALTAGSMHPAESLRVPLVLRVPLEMFSPDPASGSWPSRQMRLAEDANSPAMARVRDAIVISSAISSADIMEKAWRDAVLSARAPCSAIIVERMKRIAHARNAYTGSIAISGKTRHPTRRPSERQ